MRLAISVVSHGHGSLLATTLDDVSRFAPLSSEVIVTLNIAEAEDFDRSRWPNVVWIENQKPHGFGKNHNAALAGREADWFAIVNPDIRLEKDPFEPLLAMPDPDQRLGLVVPAIRDSSGKEQDAARRLPTPWSIAQRTLARVRRVSNLETPNRQHEWYAGMFMIISRSAFERIGGFNERFFLYCEDVDLCIRLSLAGYRLTRAEHVNVIHDAQRDSFVKIKHLRWHLASLFRLWLSPMFWQYWLLRKRNGKKIAQA